MLLRGETGRARSSSGRSSTRRAGAATVRWSASTAAPSRRSSPRRSSSGTPAARSPEPPTRGRVLRRGESGALVLDEWASSPPWPSRQASARAPGRRDPARARGASRRWTSASSRAPTAISPRRSAPVASAKTSTTGSRSSARGPAAPDRRGHPRAGARVRAPRGAVRRRGGASRPALVARLAAADQAGQRAPARERGRAHGRHERRRGARAGVVRRDALRRARPGGSRTSPPRRARTAPTRCVSSSTRSERSVIARTMTAGRGNQSEPRGGSASAATRSRSASVVTRSRRTSRRCCGLSASSSPASRPLHAPARLPRERRVLSA